MYAFTLLLAANGSNVSSGAWMTLVLPVLCLILVLTTWFLVLRRKRGGE
jgi:hypothetical protein